MADCLGRLWRDMVKPADAMTTEEQDNRENESPSLDSKYRLILVAAQRSKQLQRGARPRVEMDSQRHKPTRIALEEGARGMIDFSLIGKVGGAVSRANSSQGVRGPNDPARGRHPPPRAGRVLPIA